MNYSMTLVILASTLITVMVVILYVKTITEKHIFQQDDKKIAKLQTDLSNGNIPAGNTTVIELIIENLHELRGYYVISKNQATRSFTSSLIVCFLGFSIFVCGIIYNMISTESILLYTTISGCIVEIISGLFFWMYSQSLAQLNLYHQRLGVSEKYLTAMQFIEKMAPENRDERIKYLVEVMLIDNATIVRSKSPVQN